jgi:hypothetical protein
MNALLASIQSTQQAQAEKRREPKVAACSFGVGVQSTTLAFLTMAKDPELLRCMKGLLPTKFVFSDTGDEPASVYRHLESMKSTMTQRGLELTVLCRGSLGEHILGRIASGRRGMSSLPLFVRGKDGTMGPMRRKCTSDFKSRLIDPYMRDYAAPRGFLSHWMGISMDEAHRMRTTLDDWRVFDYPLVEMRWTRERCIEYLREQVYVDGNPTAVVKSACYFCPFRRPEEWRRLRDEDPVEWQRALDFEAKVTAAPLPGMREIGYLNRRGVSIAEYADVGSTQNADVSWDAECAGVCGV